MSKGEQIRKSMTLASRAVVLALCSGLATGLTGCDEADATAQAQPTGDAETADAGDVAAKKIGYDLRKIKPRKELLREAFDRMSEEARAEGKRVAVLFSADWCKSCQRLEAELGNMHPQDKIGDVRILVLKEEDWEGATRMNEFNKLRLRWEPVIGTYPLFVLTTEDGARLEEMKDAISRMEGEGLQPTLDNWFATSRMSGL